MLATTRIILSRVEMRVTSITAVKLIALHHELAVDPLRWFVDFAMGKHGHSSDAVFQQLQGSKSGTLLVRTTSFDNVSWADSLFYIGSRRAGDTPAARCLSNQGFQRSRARSTTFPWTCLVECWWCRRRRWCHWGQIALGADGAGRGKADRGRGRGRGK